MSCELQVLAAVPLPDLDATAAFGRRLGKHLRPGQVLALVGELGAGKTTLVRALAQALDLDDPDAVASPTYLLVVEHPGRVPLIHADAYLPAKLHGFLDDGGLDYLLGQPAVVAVEWADRIAPLLPEGTLWMELTVTSDGGRVALCRSRRPQDFPWLQLGPNIADQQ
jgi:tRNA threonylcarbamoyladenosine biosynthesis protein TsaE